MGQRAGEDHNAASAVKAVSVEGCMKNTFVEFRNGKGADGLKAKDTRLCAKWRWSLHQQPPYNYKSKWKRTPGQCSEAMLSGKFELHVTQWHRYYEASVRRQGEHLWSTSCLNADSSNGSESILTRVDAQITAEKLMVEFAALATEAAKCEGA